MADQIILGAGIAGLGASYASGFQFPVYEQEAYAGGLCSSFETAGFRFDRAVHMSFTTSELVRQVLDQTPYHCHYPYPRNWYYDRWIKHPVQNNLYALPVEKRVQAVKSFVERPVQTVPENFAEWNIVQLGQYISEEFSFPYNQKYWSEDLSKLGISWIRNRIYQPELEEVLTGSYTGDTKNTYYAKEMRYPQCGGYEAFLNPLIQKSKIHYGKKATEIDGNRHRISFSDGTELTYGSALSSIPLTEMVRIIKGAPDTVMQAAGRLGYTGIVLVSVGFLRKMGLKDIWFYIYDKDILAARVYSPSNKSPDNVPPGCSSLQFEIYFKGNSIPLQEVCIQNTRMALERLKANGAISLNIEKDIAFLDYRVQKYGNVILYPSSHEDAAIIRSYLNQIGIVPIGRFGEWDYLWSDQAFLSGYFGVKGTKTCTE